MAIYLSYEDYTAYGGSADNTTFNNLQFEAASVLDWYTFGRLRSVEYINLPEEVKRCMFAVILLIQQQQVAQALPFVDGSTSNGSAGSISSQSNDGVSASYNVLSAKDALESAREEVSNIIRQYLAYVTDSAGRKVLYRGLYPGE